MKALIELNKPEVVSTTAAQLVVRDPETGKPIAEIAIRGAGYVVLTEEEKRSIAETLLTTVTEYASAYGEFGIPDRDGGYLGEPRLWEEVATAQAEKRAASRGGGVVKVAGKRVRVVEKLEDIAYPEGCKFDADGIVIVPSRKGETADMKRFRRACKRAKAQQMAFLAAQRDPSSVEEGEADEEGED